MLPYLELVLLFISLVYKKSNGVNSCRVSFSNQGHALVGHLIRTLEKKTFESCTFSCELEPQCYSVNYVASRKTCELNNASKDYFPDDLISRKGAFYMEMVIRVYQPCRSMRCENGGTCVVSPSVHCKCLQGFSGLRCESMNIFYLPLRCDAVSGVTPCVLRKKGTCAFPFAEQVEIQTTDILEEKKKKQNESKIVK